MPHSDPPSDPIAPVIASAPLPAEASPPSFSQRFTEIAPAVHAWACLRIPPGLRVHIEPEDLLQEVWYRGMRFYDRYDPATTPFRGWIFRIAGSVLLEGFRWLRSRGQVIRDAITDAPGFHIQEVPDEGTTVSRQVARDEELRACAAWLIATLNDEEKLLFLHRGLEGMAYRDIATLMDRSLEEVKGEWRRLRERLKDRLPARIILGS